MSTGDVREVSIKDLKVDPQNANEGTPRGAQMVNSSLANYGAGRSVLLDKEGTVIAGNKTVQEWKALGFERVLLVPSDGSMLVAVLREDLDLDTDPRARELAIVDNRANEVGLKWNEDALRAQWDQGIDLTKFWTETELDLWMEMPYPEAEDFDELPDELPGAAALKPEMFFESDEIYQIPPLLPEMLGDPPDPVDVWAGPDASDPDWPGWWVYCYGSDSIRGLDWSRTILAFYVDDYRFEGWFLAPHVYTAKALNAGLTTIVSPNFSVYSYMAEALQIFQVYRARWMGRYFQEAGLKVIPDAYWGNQYHRHFVNAGIPKGAPVISIQIQTVGTEAEAKLMAQATANTIEDLEPQAVMFYGGGDLSKRLVAQYLPADLQVIWVESRVIRRHDRVMTVDHRLEEDDE